NGQLMLIIADANASHGQDRRLLTQSENGGSEINIHTRVSEVHDLIVFPRDGKINEHGKKAIARERLLHTVREAVTQQSAPDMPPREHALNHVFHMNERHFLAGDGSDHGIARDGHVVTAEAKSS